MIQAPALAAVVTASLAAQRAMPPGLGRGHDIFASACASCHGLDGRGGERAPNIAQAPAVRRLSDRQLTHIISEGVTGTGMPAFHSIGATGIAAVVKYLRVLEGRGQPSVLPGNPTRGHALFFGRAACASCHMIAGQGGFLAADLSLYARDHSAGQIREAILNPGRSAEPHPEHVLVTMADGTEYDGLIRNQDNFSIQLQTVDGTYHFLNRAQVALLKYQTTPLMPANYATTLNSTEINDIVVYLIAAAESSKVEAVSEHEQ